MTPLPVIADTYRCSLEWTPDSPGQKAVNVIHVTAPGFSAATIGAALDASFDHDAFQSVANTVGVSTIGITPLDGSSASLQYSVTSSNFIGQTAGDWSPSSSPVVSLYTGKRGRSYRGRVFLPFTAEAAISDGQLVGAIAVDILSGWEATQTALSLLGISMVVASYKHATAQEITKFAVLPAIGTQRKRQTRVRYP